MNEIHTIKYKYKDKLLHPKYYIIKITHFYKYILKLFYHALYI